MAMNYAKGKPVGDNGAPLFDSPPAVKSLVSRMSENATASSVITVTQNTTAVEVTAQTAPILVRWVATSDTEGSVFGNASIMNFDHVVPVHTTTRFVIPIESASQGGEGSVVGDNRANGLFRRYAWKTNGVASAFSQEYGKSNSY